MTALATVTALFHDPAADEICEAAPADLHHRDDVRTVAGGCAQLCSACCEDHERACAACGIEIAGAEERDDTYGEDE